MDTNQVSGQVALTDAADAADCDCSLRLYLLQVVV